MDQSVMPAASLWPLIAYFVGALLVVAVMIGGSYLLGERTRRPAASAFQPFESGIVATGTPALRFFVSFYLVAIFFVIFDIEAVFIFAWAIAFREVGWAGYLEIAIFVAVLLVALAYLWKIGALDWRTSRQKSLDV